MCAAMVFCPASAFASSSSGIAQTETDKNEAGRADVFEASISEIKTMLPKLHSTNFEGMELIRPLYKVKEKDIINWAEYNGFKFLQCACKMTEKNADIELTSKRKEIKQLIADIKEQNPEADDNIFRSLHNVNMATMPGWRDSDSGNLHSFLEKY